MARVRRTDRGVIRLTGADRATWLQGLVTNDLLALGPGRRIYSAWLTPQGRMITDLWLIAAPEALLLDVPAPLSAALATRLDGLVFAEDVQVADLSATVACNLMVGTRVLASDVPATHVPRAEVHGAEASAGILSGMPPAGAAHGVLVGDDTYGRPCLVAYGDFEALLDAHGLTSLRGAPEVGLDTFEVFRIEAGVPRFLADMTEDTIPLEAGIEDRAISFTKGCYVGQEIIVRVTTRGGGRVARRLVGLMVDAGGAQLDEAPSADGGHAAAVPAAGAPLHAGERVVGHLTSVARSPRFKSVIALGYVHRDFVSPGTRLEVRHAEQQVPAVVTPLPFVDASR